MLSAPKQPSSILSTGCEVVNFHGDYLLIEYASSSERSQEPVEYKGKLQYPSIRIINFVVLLIAAIYSESPPMQEVLSNIGKRSNVVFEKFKSANGNTRPQSQPEASELEK